MRGERRGLFRGTVIAGVPLGKGTEAGAEGGGGLVAEVGLEGGGVGIGHGNVSGLHGDEFLVGLEVIVLREDMGRDEFFLKDGDEVEEVLGGVVADVVDHVGRDGEAVFTILLLWGVLHDANNALHDVIDIGEVAHAVAVVEDLDGLTLAELVGEAKIGHVGTASGTIDGEETEAGGGDVVELGIGVGHELVGLLGGGIEGDGIVYLVVGGIGDLLVGAIDGGAGGIDEMLDLMMAASLEDVVEADEVGLDVGIGVGDGVADTSLCGEVDDNGDGVLGEEAVDGGLVGDVALDEVPRGGRRARGYNLGNGDALTRANARGTVA